MVDHLLDAARRRSTEALQAVRETLATLERHGASVTVRRVAADAGVSRNFIYTNPTARQLVDAARERAPRRVVQRSDEPRRASEQSLLTRLAASAALVEELRAENAELRVKTDVLIAEVLALQNPEPAHVTQIRRRRF